MRPLRFATYSGIVWACGTLLLILISLAQGDYVSWVELDFRPLTGTLLIASEALGLGSHFERIITYIENGMPITPVNVVLSTVLGLADGFVSGFLIALIYNFIRGKRTSQGFSVLNFALATGIIFGLCSGLLAVLSVEYSLDLKTFDFSIRPLFLAFTAVPDPGADGLLSAAKLSYMLFPHSYTEVPAWAVWGFLDGFIGGAVGAYIYLRIKVV